MIFYIMLTLRLLLLRLHRNSSMYNVPCGRGKRCGTGNFLETFIMGSIKSAPMGRMCHNDLSFKPQVRSIPRLIPATGNQ